LAQDIAQGEQAAVAEAWTRLLRATPPTHQARDLYKGRAFSLAASGAHQLGSDFAIISAGLGLVRADTKIPSYDITARAGGPASVRDRIVGEFSLPDWWDVIKCGPFSADLRRDFSGKRLLLCLSRSYLEMIQNDLRNIIGDGGDLRIFGLSLDRAVPGELRPFIMPYDARLAGFWKKGTKSDFAQRALSHYIEVIVSKGLPLEAEKLLIQRLLDTAPAPESLPRRQRLSDLELKAVIVELLPTVGRSRTRLLAVVRKERGLACEQSRFSRLCDEVLGGTR
jgi:hypothetical protein